MEHLHSFKLSFSLTFLLRADARFVQRSGAKLGVRVQEPFKSCLECRRNCLPAGRKAKTVTTVPAIALAQAGQLTHIVRVMVSSLFIIRAGNYSADYQSRF